MPLILYVLFLIISYHVSHPTDGFYKVIEVIDGDTIIIENGEHIRYIGVDTPETVHPSKPIECFGKEASDRNKELVEGKIVFLESDVEDKDEYGRLLRYVYIPQGSVSAILISGGYGYSYYFPPNEKHYDDFLKLELQAKSSRVGLWSKCQ
jgi:micrococcal nuclease